jgi:transposase
METKIIFSELLNLGDDWKVDSVDYSTDLQSIDITIEYIKSQGYCPQTGELSPVYDFRKERKWQHLPLWQLKTFIKCKIPRIKNSLEDVVSLEVPWAETSKRYSFFLKNM